MTELVRESKQGKVVVARLKNKKELMPEIENLCIKHNIKSGYIPVLIGGLQEAELISMKSAGPELENQKITHKGPFEVQGSGTISLKDGKPFPHIHINLAKFGNEALTGHLVRGKIALFIEIVIEELEDVKMIRKEDADVFNLPLLNFED